MAILDDLNGILTPEQIARINGDATLTAKLAKKDELYGFYVGEDEPVNTPPANKTPVNTPVNTPPAAANFDLSSIESLLDKKLGKINEIVDARVAEVVKTRGDELVNNAVKISLQRNDELNRIYLEHQANFGEVFDSTKFNSFLEENKDKGFRTIRQAYDAYVAPQTMEREVERRANEKVAKQSGSHVPGSTPPPSSNSNIKVFMQRGRATDGTGMTGAQRAAAALDKKLANDAAMAS